MPHINRLNKYNKAADKNEKETKEMEQKFEILKKRCIPNSDQIKLLPDHRYDSIGAHQNK